MFKKRYWVTGLLALGLLLGTVSITWAAEDHTQLEERGRALRGEVTDISGHTLSVQTGRGTVHIVTNENTVFRLPEMEEGSISDIAVGDMVAVVGEWSGEGNSPSTTFHARLVAVVPPEAKLARVGGQVTTIENGSITVVTRFQETAVIQIDNNTIFRIPGVDEPSLEDIQVGGIVVAGGVQNENGTLQAKILAVPQENRGIAFRGQVTAIAGHTLTVEIERGEVHVVTNENTIFRLPEVEGGSINDIAVGDRVIVRGERSGESDTFHAQMVAAISDPAQLDRVSGQVTAIEGHQITINTRSGEPVTLQVDEDTQIRIDGVEEPGLENIHLGNILVAAGTQNEDGAFQAKWLTIPKEAERNGRLAGELVTIEGTRLTLRTGEKGLEVILLTDAETTVVIPEVENGSLVNLQTGDRVIAAVRVQEGTLYAQTVTVLPQQPARIVGRVSHIEGSELVLETHQGTVRVLTGNDTHFRVPNVETPSLADLEEGIIVLCGGSWEEEGTTFRALVVIIRPMGKETNHVRTAGA